MHCRISFLVLFLALPSGIFADFHYTETTKVTGGLSPGMMKVAGTFSKQARHIGDPVTESIYVKGNRKVRLGLTTPRSLISTKRPSPTSTIRRSSTTRLHFSR